MEIKVTYTQLEALQAILRVPQKMIQTIEDLSGHAMGDWESEEYDFWVTTINDALEEFDGLSEDDSIIITLRPEEEEGESVDDRIEFLHRLIVFLHDRIETLEQKQERRESYEVEQQFRG
jgi:hypothetical protein